MTIRSSSCEKPDLQRKMFTGMTHGGEYKNRFHPLHPEARLTGAEKDRLIRGLTATFNPGN